MARSRYQVVFTPEASRQLGALPARDRRRLLDAAAAQLPLEPLVVTRNRKPMDVDKRFFVAPWELRVGNLRVYYAVESAPAATVVVVAVGVKVRERVRISGTDVEP